MASLGSLSFVRFTSPPDLQVLVFQVSFCNFPNNLDQKFTMSQEIKTLKTSDWFHSDEFPIAVEVRKPQTPFGLHNHEFCEIVLITGGTGKHVTGEQAWAIHAGDAFVISGLQTHTYEEMEDLCLMNILYQPEQLSWEVQGLAALPGYHALFTLEPALRAEHEFKSRLQLSPLALANVMHLLDKLEDELKKRSPGYRCMATTLFMQIVCTLSRNYENCSSTNSQSLLRLAEAISHLERYYDEPISLVELARIAKMPTRSFQRAFKISMGVTPITFRNQVRVSRAVELLRNKEMSITDVAFELKYEDSSYFTRQFKTIVGMTPKEYRRHFNKWKQLVNLSVAK